MFEASGRASLARGVDRMRMRTGTGMVMVTEIGLEMGDRKNTQWDVEVPVKPKRRVGKTFESAERRVQSAPRVAGQL